MTKHPQTTWKPLSNETKPLTFLLALTFLFLFSGSVFADDFQDAVDAYKRKDYKTAYKLFLPLAEQGNAFAQALLGAMYFKGDGVPQDYKESFKWYRLAAEKRLAGLGVFFDKGWEAFKGNLKEFF